MSEDFRRAEATTRRAKEMDGEAGPQRRRKRRSLCQLRCPRAGRAIRIRLLRRWGPGAYLGLRRLRQPMEHVRRGMTAWVTMIMLPLRPTGRRAATWFDRPGRFIMASRTRLTRRYTQCQYVP